MIHLLQDPISQVLGQKKFLRLCCFGTNPRQITPWMQKTAWENHPKHKTMLYSLHTSYHAKTPFTTEQQQFIKIDCANDSMLLPLFQMFG